MDSDLIKLIATIAFLLVIGFFAVISLLAMYVFIRYGRTRSITTMTSLVFTGVFVLGALAAFVSLQRIF